MKYFVVVYDRAGGRLERLRSFSTAQAALQERFRWERLRPDAEVVVLAAQSKAALQRTHGRYFNSSDELLRQAGVIAE